VLESWNDGLSRAGRRFTRLPSNSSTTPLLLYSTTPCISAIGYSRSDFRPEAAVSFVVSQNMNTDYGFFHGMIAVADRSKDSVSDYKRRKPREL
jgi:hypothetical protein